MDLGVAGSFHFGFRRHSLVLPCALLSLGLFALGLQFPLVTAQTQSPVLISEETSTRALVFDSTTRQREPFTAVAPVAFAADTRRRIMLFAMRFQLQPGDTASAVTARAEDGAHQTYVLPVEHVGATPGQPWATSIVVSLDPAMGDLGDVLVGISYRGVCLRGGAEQTRHSFFLFQILRDRGLLQ